MQLEVSRRVSAHFIMMDVAPPAPAGLKQHTLTTQPGSNWSQNQNRSGASSGSEKRTTGRPAGLSSCWSGLILTLPAWSFYLLVVRVSWKLLVRVQSDQMSCRFLSALPPTPPWGQMLRSFVLDCLHTHSLYAGVLP